MIKQPTKDALTRYLESRCNMPVREMTDGGDRLFCTVGYKTASVMIDERSAEMMSESAITFTEEFHEMAETPKTNIMLLAVVNQDEPSEVYVYDVTGDKGKGLKSRDEYGNVYRTYIKGHRI